MKKIIIILSVLVGIGMSACGTLEPIKTPQLNTYQLTINTVDNNCIGNNKNVLQVNQMHALSPFNSNKMFYSTAENTLASYAMNQWVSQPSEMLSNNIIQYLSGKCIYANVVTSGFVTNSQYRLNTQLIRLSLDTRDGKNTVNLIVIAQLVDNKTNSVIKSKTFNLQHASDENPLSMVSVSNKLGIQLVEDIANWLITA